MKPNLLFAFFFVILAYFSGHAQMLSGSSWQETQANKFGTLNILYYKMNGLIELKDGKPVGICADMMSAFVEHLQKQNISLKLYYKTGYDSFKDFYGEIKKSPPATFGLGNLTITNERKHEILFSQPFMTNVAFLVTGKQTPVLKSLKNISNEFKDYTAYVAKGTTHERLIQTLKTKLLPNLPIIYCPSSRISLENVAANPKSFCYVDLILYLDATKNKSLPVQRQSSGDRFGEKFGVMMPLKSDWAPVFNTFLNAYINSAEFQASLSTHLGPEATKIINIYAKKKK